MLNRCLQQLGFDNRDIFMPNHLNLNLVTKRLETCEGSASEVGPQEPDALLRRGFKMGPF